MREKFYLNFRLDPIFYLVYKLYYLHTVVRHGAAQVLFTFSVAQWAKNTKKAVLHRSENSRDWEVRISEKKKCKTGPCTCSGIWVMPYNIAILLYDMSFGKFANIQLPMPFLSMNFDWRWHGACSQISDWNCRPCMHQRDTSLFSRQRNPIWN